MHEQNIFFRVQLFDDFGQFLRFFKKAQKPSLGLKKRFYGSREGPIQKCYSNPKIKSFEIRKTFSNPQKFFKSENVFQIRKTFSNTKNLFQSEKLFQIQKCFSNPKMSRSKLPLTFDLREPMAETYSASELYIKSLYIKCHYATRMETQNAIRQNAIRQNSNGTTH